MNSKDFFSLGKPAEVEKNRRDSSNPEDASISTGQPAATSTPTNLIRKSARVVLLRRSTAESDLRNSSLVGRIPESWGHIKGRKNIRAPDTPERAPRTRNVSCSPKTPYTSKQPKTPRSANRLAGLVKEKYAHIKGRKQIQALSSPQTEPQSSLKTPKTPKGTTTKHPKTSPKTPKMSPYASFPINLPTGGLPIPNDVLFDAPMEPPKNPAKTPVKSLTNTLKQSPIKSAMISPTNSPIQSTNYLPAKSATGSPKTPTMNSSRKSSIESPKFSPIILPKTSPIPSPKNSPTHTRIESPKSPTELPTSSPKKSTSNSSINLPIMLPINPEMSPKADAPKAGSYEVGLLTAGAIIAPPDLRVGNKRSLASSEPTSVGNASTSESSPKRARLHVLQVSMGSPFSMTRSKKIKKVEVDQDEDEQMSIEISANENQDGLPEVLAEPEGSAQGSGMDPQMVPQLQDGVELGVEPVLEPGMQPEIIDAITSPEANANTSMKCIVM